jgi:XTP/dITP diphosphohydrolase
VRIPGGIVLASANAGKLREMRAILAPLGLEVRSLGEFTEDSPVEDGLSFVENAIIKARFAAGAAGLPAIADDSGLEVDALGGDPGIRSARYAGEGADAQANNQKLLEALSGVPPAERSARFRCAMVFMRWPLDPAPLISQACWEGRIATRVHGAGGFGYDPLFLPAGLEGTAAELDPDAKNRLSHRGQALRGLVAALAGMSADR